MKGFTDGKSKCRQCLLGVSGFEAAITGFQKHRLFFYLVVLKAQRVASLNEKNFTDVLRRLGPEDLIAPRFFGLFTQRCFRFCGQDNFLPHRDFAGALHFFWHSQNQGSSRARRGTKCLFDHLIL